MDEKLVSWARAVKRRRKARLPVLWLFTDTQRLADPVAAVRGLPPGLAGVVFRDHGAAVAARVARECALRRLPLVMVGRDPARRAAPRPTPGGGGPVGVHLRGGRRADCRPRFGIITASAHNVAEVMRANRAKADIIFISPVFATASHPGRAALGPIRWNFLARYAKPGTAYALGGVDGRKIKFLAGRCCGAAGISSLI